jgi:hypothetical protein
MPNKNDVKNQKGDAYCFTNPKSGGKVCISKTNKKGQKKEKKVAPNKVKHSGIDYKILGTGAQDKRRKENLKHKSLPQNPSGYETKEGKYLKKYSKQLGNKRFKTFQEAHDAMKGKNIKHGGITKSIKGFYTVREGSQPIDSPSGEVSYILRSQAARQARQGNSSLGLGTIAGINYGRGSGFALDPIPRP